MTISTIITVYNLEKYIEEALQSVFSQTRLPDEIVVIDDCSTDNSAEILSNFSSRIKYIRMPKNSGVLMAFIRGIEESTGDILTFLDGDDIWCPNKVEKIEKAFAENKNRILVTHDYECINGDGENRSYSDQTHFNTQRIVKEAANLDQMDELLRNSILSFKGVWLGSAFSLRRSCFNVNEFKELMMEMPDYNSSYQDHPIATYVVLQNKRKKIFYIDEILFKYRIFGTNSSGVSNNLKSALRTLDKAKATLLRTSSQVAQHPELTEENERQKLMMMNIEYLQELYNKNYLKALKYWLKLSLNLWNGKEKFKELQRFIGVVCLGPEKFLNLKSLQLN